MMQYFVAKSQGRTLDASLIMLQVLFPLVVSVHTNKNVQSPCSNGLIGAVLAIFKCGSDKQSCIYYPPPPEGLLDLVKIY